MDRNSIYYKQVQLLLRVLPLITEEDCFALKGGTAINLFVRDFPRLSVDIDLVYLPKGSRKEALSAVSQALNRIATSIENTLSPADAIRNYLDKPDALRLLVRKDKVTIKSRYRLSCAALSMRPPCARWHPPSKMSSDMRRSKLLPWKTSMRASFVQPLTGSMHGISLMCFC